MKLKHLRKLLNFPVKKEINGQKAFDWWIDRWIGWLIGWLWNGWLIVNCIMYCLWLDWLICFMNCVYWCISDEEPVSVVAMSRGVGSQHHHQRLNSNSFVYNPSSASSLTETSPLIPPAASSSSHHSHNSQPQSNYPASATSHIAHSNQAAGLAGNHTANSSASFRWKRKRNDAVESYSTAASSMLAPPTSSSHAATAPHPSQPTWNAASSASSSAAASHPPHHRATAVLVNNSNHHHAAAAASSHYRHHDHPSGVDVSVIEPISPAPYPIARKKMALAAAMVSRVHFFRKTKQTGDKSGTFSVFFWRKYGILFAD